MQRSLLAPIRWKQVSIWVAIVCAPILLIWLLTKPIVGCIDYYADGSQVTHYGKQCLEVLVGEPVDSMKI